MTDITDQTPELSEDASKKPRLGGTKQVARAVVGVSVRFAVAGTLSHFVPVESRKDKIKLAVATYTISGVVSEACKDFAVDRIDYYLGVTDEIKALKAKVESDKTDETAAS